MRHSQALHELSTYGNALLEDAGSGRANTPHGGGIRTWQQRWRSPQVAFASLGFLVFGNIGMAAAANSAVPGDILYPIDQAYENVIGLFGGNGNRAVERLEEASVLIARGQFDLAMETISVAAGEFDTDAAITISSATTRLGHLGTNVTNREDLHRATFALLTTVSGLVNGNGGTDMLTWKVAIDDCAAAVVDVANGQPFVPPGQDDTFVPPGQEGGSTPPGLVDKAVPPGQDDTFVPPGQSTESTTPDQNDTPATFLPPGQDDTFAPPGQGADFTRPGNGRGRGQGQGRDK
jgi:hypothetical protein